MELEDESFDEIDSGAEAPFHLETKKTMIYSLHVLLNQFESHLDTFTHKYKILTLRWLLATFAAVGFLFSVELSNPKINNLLMAGIVSLFGVIGITSIWYMDLFIFQKFWGVFFVEEVKMEKKHLFLTKIRDTSLSLDNIKTRIHGHGSFYIFSNIILTITGGVALSFFQISGIAKIFTSLSIIVFALAIIGWMKVTEDRLQKAIEDLLKV